MSTFQLVAYYINLLIKQWWASPKAQATISAITAPTVMCQITTQTINFSTVPSSGAYVLSWNGNNTASINWNDSAATVQGKLQAVEGLSSVLFDGVTVTFNGVIPPASLLVVVSSTINATITITETDLTLPLAVLNAYNLIGPNPAQGVQLDILGKYVGVTRNGYDFSGPTSLSDANFLKLINIVIIQNYSNGTLASIDMLLDQYFPGEIFVYDYLDMTMSYVINSGAISDELAQFFVLGGFLPKPMGVGLRATVYENTDNNFFGFRTYDAQSPYLSGFNTYDDYNLDEPWLNFSNLIYPL